jgi:alkylation response protein AidB-like acyl-CoA dehydrogenase
VSDDDAALRAAFRAFFDREVPTERVRRAEAAEPPGFDPDLWAQAQALGVPDLAADATVPQLLTIAEAAGRRLAPIPVVETFAAARLLARVAVESAGMVTLAVRPTRDGVATLVPGGAVADAVVALEGDELVLARQGRIGPAAATLGAAPLASWRTDDRTVLGRGPDAVAAFDRAVDEWRLLTAAALVGLARRALELGVDYARSRHQFGVPIGSFQAIQHRLADVATALDAAGALVARAAEGPADARFVAAAFLAASRAARDTTAASLHVHGGYGFMLEYDIQLYFRRASAWPLALGDPADELGRLAGLLAAGDWELPEPAAAGFRAEVRAVLEDACTDEVIERVQASGTVHDWVLYRRLAEHGLIAAGWPESWGGQGRDEQDLLALWDELERIGAPADGWGTSELVARTLAIAGTDEQRAEIVPRILRGEILVSLGYSEPDSGSDVAAAKTRAERDGHRWVINGQKMFTTLAHEAEYVFLLTRTNPDVAKHRGLTMFLVPLSSPGIEIRPIHTLSGERTNVTYYTDVVVPDSSRVGAVDGGWDVMRVALAFERHPTMVGELDRVLRRFLAWARYQPGVLDRPAVAARIADAWIDVEAGRGLATRMAAITARGDLPIVEGSMAKLWSSEALGRATAGLLDALGAEGVLAHGAGDAPADGWVEAMHRHAPVTTIRAGTSEIQRSIIAERGLNLPRSSR